MLVRLDRVWGNHGKGGRAGAGGERARMGVEGLLGKGLIPQAQHRGSALHGASLGLGSPLPQLSWERQETSAFAATSVTPCKASGRLPEQVHMARLPRRHHRGGEVPRHARRQGSKPPDCSCSTALRGEGLELASLWESGSLTP